PSNWSLADQYFSNAVELVAPAGRARTLVTTEQEKDHASALRRLAEVAAEVGTRPQYLSIAGWPGLERHYLFSRGRTGQLGAEQGEDRGWRVTTAIAADAILVRLETTYRAKSLTPGGQKLKDFIVRQAALIGRVTIATKRGKLEETQRETDLLRQNLPSPPSD